MKNGKIIAVANQKGGVAKTTSVRNIAYSLGELGKRVLAVDFDPQANLTASFVDDSTSIHTTIAEAMNKAMDEEEMPNKAEYIHSHGKVDFIPSSIHLSVVEANLRMEMGSEKLLSNILEPLRDNYDFILIDTNPSLGPLTINALSAADSVIIPINPEYYATMGLTDLTKTIIKIRKRINPGIQFEGILMTMCDMQTNLHKEVCAEVTEAYGNGMKIFQTQIPRSIRVGEANRYGMSVIDFDRKSKAGLAYGEVAKELIANGNKTNS
ncbi:MAG TPA: AAA family ATPase [Spirochaetales bacterium]|nr:AAA family ATPase [Spirochaetales bacterium]